MSVEGEIEKLLREVGVTRMPYGKYGPEEFPPDGVPIYDLPYPYLAVLARRGFPDGRLGRMLHFVYCLKRDGADPPAFDQFRLAAGGRHPLRKPRRRRWEFPEDD